MAEMAVVGRITRISQKTQINTKQNLRVFVKHPYLLKDKMYALSSVLSTTRCQLDVEEGGTQRPSVSPTAPPSFFNPSWEKERGGEAEILLQGIHLITETELIAS